MNKEEVKLKLLKQLHNSGSDLRHLTRFTGRYRYPLSSVTFYCSEFNLRIDMNRIEDSDRYNVVFYENANLNDRIPGQIDLSNRKELEAEVFYTENVTISRNKITCWVCAGHLYSRNYHITLDNTHVTQKAIFDLSTWKFLSETDLDNYLRVTEEIKKNSGLVYFDAIIRDVHIDDFKKQIRMSTEDAMKMENLLSIFERLEGKEQDAVTSLLTHLRNIEREN